MVTSAAEVPVVGRALLVAMGRAHRAVHLEDDAFDYLDTIISDIDKERATTDGDANSYLTATSLFNRCR